MKTFPRNVRNLYGLIQNFKMPGVGRPPAPVIFTKPVQSLIEILQPRQEIELTSIENTFLIYEIELGVVIDKHARQVSKREARDLIKSYCLLIDITRKNDNEQPVDLGTIFGAKSGDNFTPVGPVFRTEDLQLDSTFDLVLNTCNGSLKGSSMDMFYGIDEAVSEISRFVTLQPNDLIMMGTPGKILISHGDIASAQVLQNGKLLSELSFKVNLHP